MLNHYLEHLELITQPAGEPLSLASVKDHLRVEITDDDALISALMVAARQQIEHETGLALVTQTWDLFLDRWPRQSGVIRIPKPPLQSVSSISFIDEDGNEQTWDPSKYVVSAGTPGRVVIADGEDFPDLEPRPDAVTVRFVSGFGAAEAVPESLKAAIKLLVGTLYEHRESVVTMGSPAVLTDVVERLITRYRQLSI